MCTESVHIHIFLGVCSRASIIILQFILSKHKQQQQRRRKAKNTPREIYLEQTDTNSKLFMLFRASWPAQQKELTSHFCMLLLLHISAHFRSREKTTKMKLKMLVRKKNNNKAESTMQERATAAAAVAARNYVYTA